MKSTSFIFMIIIFFVVIVIGNESQGKEIHQKQYSLIIKLEQENSELRSLILNRENVIREHIQKDVKNDEKIKNDFKELEKKISEQESKIQSLSESSKESITGTWILLIGFLIEVFGALVLGAPTFLAKIKELERFDVRDGGFDLAMTEPKKDDLLVFVSMLGHMLLFFGFSVQVVGTAILLSSDPLNETLIISVSILVILGFIYWLLGFDPGQTRKEKIHIISKNISKLVTRHINSVFLQGKDCEVCLKKLSNKDAFVSWYDEGNSKEYPYLNLPCDFKVGHKSCLENWIISEVGAEGNIERNEEIKAYFYLKDAQDFVSNNYSKYKIWFEGHYDHWFKIRTDWKKPAPSEVLMDQAKKKIEKLN